MRLTEFIQTNHKSIIEDWVKFARSLLPWARGMSEKGLRDHAEELLTAVVTDMDSSQSTDQQTEKSKGRAIEGELAKVGQKHATDRLETGLNLDQLVSEYRALRASVLRLWDEAQGDAQQEVTRFNEAIDETLTMSVARYSETLNNTREQFLGILSHDLRNPIGAIIMGATLLAESVDPDNVEIAASILNSGERMNRMVNDLLDLTRTRLGTGIPVTQKPMELASVCRQMVSELQAIHPKCQLRFQSNGDLHGEWDSDRLAQVVSNLVSNALQYGLAERPVSVVAQGDGQEVILEVHNDGSPIPESAMKTIFEPMARHQSGGQESDRNTTGLGLGLFIASEIVTAHGGTISVTSTEKAGTKFTVKIPRRQSAKKPHTDLSERPTKRPSEAAPS